MKQMGLKGLLLVMFCMGLIGCGLKESVDSEIIVLDNLKLSMYSDTLVNGYWVTDAVDRYKGALSIFVQTGINSEGYYAETVACYGRTSENIAVKLKSCTMIPASRMVEDTSDNRQYYINQSGLFESKVYNDKDGHARLIVFAQRPVN